jgi:SAM-dependent methyltransferase
MTITTITQFLRRLHLMHFADNVKYYFEWLKNKSKNDAFVKKHPNVALPPSYILFESFQMNYEKYFVGGKETAQWIVDLATPFVDLQNATILDWGCGPARVVRHLKELIAGNCAVFGTDYNKKTIHWCKKNIENVVFEENDVNPPTVFDNEKFDLMYGISIFTHLSEENHHLWFSELLRISKKGGVLILTTHGDAFAAKLTDDEKIIFAKNEMVIRGNVVEGHRVFTAFQPSQYLKNMFENKVEILKHIEGQKKNWGIEQDVWILKKI